MRILHISTRLILGGSQENTVLSCEGQSRLGHDVHLAFGPIYGPEGSLLGRVNSFNCDHPLFSWVTPELGPLIKTHTVSHLVREVSPRQDRLCVTELRQLIRRIDPDIVHTHSSKAGVLGRIAAWREGHERSRQGRPLGIVHTIHGPPFMPVEGSALKRTRRRFTNWIYARAERAAAARCHVIVAVADAMTRQFLERGIGLPGQYVTVRSGMEVEDFLEPQMGQSRDELRASHGFAPDDFVIGTVARLAEHKGHDDLLDALGDEMKRDPRLKLLWVGDGWWCERLMERVRQMGLEGRVVSTGLVSEGTSELIHAMDVLAHPSYREGLPRTVPQALLCGVCPVAYDCDGTGEICRDMQTGRLVPVGDRAKLRDAILWLRDHPRERAEMAERGREECRNAFSAETMIAELEKVYARAIEIARGR